MAAASASSKPTVLLVEDDADIRTVVSEILCEEGFRVVGVAGGREALDRLQRAKRVDVILLDLIMPVMDGFEFLVRRRELGAAASVPVVAITASGQKKGLEELGVVAWLRKPMSLAMLVRTVRRWARRGPAGSNDKASERAGAKREPRAGGGASAARRARSGPHERAPRS